MAETTFKLREGKNLLIAKPLHREIKQAAMDLDKTLVEVANEAAREWLQKHREERVEQPA